METVPFPDYSYSRMIDATALRWCEEVRGLWTCTRVRGHTGRHAAAAWHSWVAVWSTLKGAPMTVNDQSTWPEHLRDDAPYAVCKRCGRKTWDNDQFGQIDPMPQPDGEACGGRFGGRSNELHANLLDKGRG